MAQREFDIVIFGATGLAGKYCIETIHKASKKDNIRFAVAGRNEGKLRQAVHEVAGWLIEDNGEEAHKEALKFENDVNIIVADVGDFESLRKMAARTKCIINTVGPYTKWGEPVIKACLDEGTHMLDLSGELHYNEGMRNKYHKQALNKGIYFLATSGFDSIPCESLVHFIKENFPGHVNAVETFNATTKGKYGAKVNTGTWNSVIEIIHHMPSVKEGREKAWREVFQKPYQVLDFPKVRVSGVSTRPEVPGYCIPFAIGDKPQASHTEFFKRDYVPDYQRTHVQTYLYYPSKIHVYIVKLIMAVVFIMSQFAYGRYLLETYPHIFSLGMFQHGGPSRKQVLTCGIALYAIGYGWFKDDDRSKEPPRKIAVKLEGPEAGYMCTSICLVHAAICLLKETDKIPVKGGYLTPGFALENTSLYDRLKQNGHKYTIVKAPQ